VIGSIRVGQVEPTAITLRPWRIDDAPSLATLYEANRPELSVTQPWRPAGFYTEAGQRHRISEGLGRQGMLNFVIVVGAVITGTIGFEAIETNAGGSADIGYWVDAAHRRRGIAARAVAIAVEYGFGTLGLSQIRANVEPGNIASRRALERNGFRLVGRRSIRLGAGSPTHLVFERSRT
jgi:[ribosomal protein S5]-alanine N-acetyltransferase